MLDKTAYWEHGSSELGAFVKCSNCGHKLSSKKFLFADIAADVCPWCKFKMDFSKLDDAQLREEALGE